MSIAADPLWALGSGAYRHDLREHYGKWKPATSTSRPRPECRSVFSPISPTLPVVIMSAWRLVTRISSYRQVWLPKGISIRGIPRKGWRPTPHGRGPAGSTAQVDPYAPYKANRLGRAKADSERRRVELSTPLISRYVDPTCHPTVSWMQRFRSAIVVRIRA